MIYAVISDVHANTEALTVCLDEIEKYKPDRIICLGDLVDYCAEPNEAVQIVRDTCDAVILGNHDEAQFNYSLAEGFSEMAYISSLHTRTVLKPGHIGYFRTLSYFHAENNLHFVHGSPCMPERYRYILNAETAELNFKYFSGQVCFIGHSHRAAVFELCGNKITEIKPGKLNKSSRFIINTGSVGQPRDGDPRSSFGIFNTESFEYRNIRLKYDIKSASEKIIKEGLPEYLAQRLFKGL